MSLNPNQMAYVAIVSTLIFGSIFVGVSGVAGRPVKVLEILIVQSKKKFQVMELQQTKPLIQTWMVWLMFWSKLSMELTR